MRAVAVKAESLIAVVAEDTKAFWPAVSLQPLDEAVAWIMFSALSMLVSGSARAYMVDGEELKSPLSTAGALSSITIKSLPPCFSIPVDSPLASPSFIALLTDVFEAVHIIGVLPEVRRTFDLSALPASLFSRCNEAPVLGAVPNDLVPLL